MKLLTGNLYWVLFKANINNNIFQFLGNLLKQNEPVALKNNVVDEVMDSKESLDKIDEGSNIWNCLQEMYIEYFSKTNINNNIFQFLGNSLHNVTEPEALKDNVVDKIVEDRWGKYLILF